MAIDQEQTDAASRPGQRRDDQGIGRRRTEHHAFLAVQHPAVAGRTGVGIARCQRIAATRLETGKSQFEAAGHQARQHGFTLRRRSRARHQAATHDVVEQGLDHQRLAAGFHRGHQVERTTAETTIGLGQCDRCQAEFGKRGPGCVAQAAGRREDRLALFEAVFVGQVLADRVSQLLLLFAVFEVHDMLRVRDPRSSWR